MVYLGLGMSNSKRVVGCTFKAAHIAATWLRLVFILPNSIRFIWLNSKSDRWASVSWDNFFSFLTTRRRFPNPIINFSFLVYFTDLNCKTYHYPTWANLPNSFSFHTFGWKKRWNWPPNFTWKWPPIFTPNWPPFFTANWPPLSRSLNRLFWQP